MAFGKNKFKRVKLLKILAFVVAAQATVLAGQTTAVGFAYVPEKEADEMAKLEPTLVSVDKSKKNEQGGVAVTATAAGIEVSNASAAEIASADAAKAAAPATSAPAQEFKIEKGIPVPEPSKRGGAKANIYPFDKLEAVGDSFLVLATEAKPKPAKTLASTVSSANKRYVKKDAAGNDVIERKFTVRPVEGGARIWRII